MAEKKGDPREMQASPTKAKAEKLAREWYAGLDIMLAGQINMTNIMAYWLTYRLVGIYDSGDAINRGLDSGRIVGDTRNLSTGKEDGK